MKKILLIVFLAALTLQLNAAVTNSYGNQSIDYAGGQNSIFLSDNTTSTEVCLPVAPITFYDDFLGPVVVFVANGSTVTGKWAKKVTGANETVAGASDGLNGYATLTLNSSIEIEQATLYANDEQNWRIGQGLVFQTRVRFSTLPTATVEAYIGMNGATSAAGSAYRCNFKLVGTTGGLIKCATDDNSTDSGLITSGVTVVANQWVILTIDTSVATSVKFYINGVRVAASTTFAYADTTNVQPYFSLVKTTAGSVGVGTLDIDYVRIWQNRM